MADWLSTYSTPKPQGGSNADQGNDWLSTFSGGQSAYRPNKLVSSIQPKTPVKQKEEKKTSVFDQVGKFVARSAVEGANFVTSTGDFSFDLLAKTIETTLRNKKDPIIKSETRNKIADKWANFYSKTAGSTLNESKEFAENLRRIEYIQPSKEWSDLSTKDKLTKKPLETVLNIGPGIVSSLGAFAINPLLGFAVSAGSVADEVKTVAMDNGVSEEKAMLLGLGTGLLVGWIDKIVPDEILSPQAKKKFISGFAKRIVKSGLKEAGTEMVQEDIQLLAEATVREDITKDEVIDRNIMSALGGFLGGSSMQTLVGFGNGVKSGDIGGANIEIALQNGTYQPQEVIDMVVGDPIQETKQGKELLKVALEAEKLDKSIVIKDGTPSLETAEQAKPEEVPAKVEEKVAPKPVVKKVAVKKPAKTAKIVKPKITKVKPKVVSVPKEQLPVGEGKEKVSRLEARVKKTLDDTSQETIDKLGTTTFKQMNKKENINKAVKYVTNNQDEALKVLSGEIEAPSGILRNSIYVAMQNKALGDVDLARKLASLQSTRFGQEISILTEIDPDSPVKLIREITEIRRKTFESKRKGKTAKELANKTAGDIRSNIKPPSKSDWAKFIRSIEC